MASSGGDRSGGASHLGDLPLLLTGLGADGDVNRTVMETFLLALVDSAREVPITVQLPEGRFPLIEDDSPNSSQVQMGGAAPSHIRIVGHPQGTEFYAPDNTLPTGGSNNYFLSNRTVAGAPSAADTHITWENITIDLNAINQRSGGWRRSHGFGAYRAGNVSFVNCRALNVASFYTQLPYTLAGGGVNSSATTLTMSADPGNKWPTDNFPLALESETVFVTSRSGATLTVTRAADGTSAAAHAAGIDLRAPTTYAGAAVGMNETFGFEAFSSNDVRFVNCEALALDGGPTATGFSMNQSNNVFWEDCRATGWDTMGFSTYYGTGVYFSKCIAQGNGTGVSGGNGINMEHTWDVWLNECTAGGKDNPTSASGVAYTENTAHGNGNGAARGGINILMTEGGGNVHIANCRSSNNNGSGLSIKGSVPFTAATGTTGTASVFGPAGTFADFEGNANQQLVGRLIVAAAGGSNQKAFRITAVNSTTQVTVDITEGAAASHSFTNGDALMLASGMVEVRGSDFRNNTTNAVKFNEPTAQPQSMIWSQRMFRIDLATAITGNTNIINGAAGGTDPTAAATTQLLRLGSLPPTSTFLPAAGGNMVSDRAYYNDTGYDMTLYLNPDPTTAIQAIYLNQQMRYDGLNLDWLTVDKPVATGPVTVRWPAGCRARVTFTGANLVARGFIG